jgi:hypothetical protein
MVKAGRRLGEALGSEEGKVMGSVCIRGSKLIVWVKTEIFFEFRSWKPLFSPNELQAS